MSTLRWALAAALAFAAPVSSYATTTDGAIITNVVSATYSTTPTPGPSSGYAVTYSATARVLAQDPCVRVTKVADPVEGQTAGGVVTFRIWVYNCSPTASMFNIMVYDNLPLNTYYNPSFESSPPDWVNKYSLDGPPPTGTFLVGDLPAGPATGDEWFEWKLLRLYPLSSAWVSYKVTIE